MINRILIRTKVVQVLYSYMLTERKFETLPQPPQPTREKRFAYALYQDLLAMMIRISDRIARRGGDKPLKHTQFIKALESDERMRPIMTRYAMDYFPLDSVVDILCGIIKESGLYKKYVKEDQSGFNTGDRIWQEIFTLIIRSNPELNSVITRREGYTMRGAERAMDMVSETFTSFYASDGNISGALAKLQESLNKARELYFRMLMLPVELVNLRDREIDENRHKYLPSAEDRNPNMRFVENQMVVALRHNEKIREYVDKNPDIAWSPADDPLLRSLMKSITESELYKDYMTFPVTDLHLDCDFWRNVFKKIIFQSSDFLETLEDKSVFWNDDIEIIGTFVLKTFRYIEEQRGTEAVLNMYKDAEDARFGRELFTYVVENKDEYKALIDEYVNKESWDTERLAFMDVIITMTAIAELLNCPKIPTNVTVNEYIEIAKSYSTSKSGQFVHGILGAIIKHLRAEKKLLKE